MATTTNYSWSTPDDTALVKDGAAAIRTLGSSADTTVKALNPGTTAGDIDYYTTSTAKARVAIGTAGQVLQVNSGATAPEWVTPAAAGGMTLLATATPSAATSISFTSISQSYKHLLLIWADCFSPSGAGIGYWLCRLNNDSGTNYRGAGLLNNGVYTSLPTNVTGFGSQAGNAPIGGMSDASMGQFVANGSMWIYDYTNGDKVGVTYQTSGENTDTGFSQTFKGVYDSSAGISQLDLVRSSTNTITGTLKLYGVS